MLAGQKKKEEKSATDSDNETLVQFHCDPSIFHQQSGSLFYRMHVCGDAMEKPSVSDEFAAAANRRKGTRAVMNRRTFCVYSQKTFKKDIQYYSLSQDKREFISFIQYI